jgi:hypothetical protein
MSEAEANYLLGRIAALAGQDDPATFRGFSVVNGTPLNSPLDFHPAAAVVDNNTSAYLALPDAVDGVNARWVAPGQPAIIPLLNRNNVARVQWTAPPNKTQPTAVVTERATVIFYRNPNPFGLGTPTAVSAPGRATAFASASRGIGTYTFIPPNLTGIKGMIVYLAVTGGGGSVAVNILNSDTTLVGGNTVTWVSSLAIASGSGVQILAYPGLPATANASANTILGQTPTISAVVTVAAATFQVDYDLLP